MRQVQINFPTATVNAISATQSITASGGGFAVLNGSLASINNINIPSATTASGQLFTPVTLPNISRTVTVFATSSATGSVITVTGKDLLGNVITATFVGASGGSSTASDAIATSPKEFAVIQAVQLSASMGNFTVGTGVSGTSLWLQTDQFATPFNMAISVVTVTSQPVTIQDTPDNPNTATAPNVFNHATLVTVTANAQSNYAFPVLFTRAIFVATGQATGPATVYFKQAGI